MVNMGQKHVVFGSGPLGMAVVRDLVARGYPVRVVNRHGQAHVPPGVEVAPADAYDPAAARHVCRDAAVVYQCAQPGYSQWQEKFPPLQASILDAAAAAGAKLMVGENLYLYGEVAGPLREDLPYAATTRKGRVRAQMAEALLAAHRAGKVRVAMARASDFFGPGVLGSALGDRVFPQALEGKGVSVFGDPDALHSYTYIDDFGRALVTLGEHDEALGQAWHVPNAPARTTRQTVEMIYQAAGRPPKIQVMGKTMLRIGGIFIPEAREMIEMLYEFEKPFVVDSSKYEQAFGQQATPLVDSIAATVAWYRTQVKPGK
jgi:nucleoside-diphosphate-sugar epimerase